MKKYFGSLFLLVLILACAGNKTFAQKKPSKADSTKVYREIEDFSGKNGITRLAYNLVFKSVDNNESRKRSKKRAYRKLTQRPIGAFEGKIIRHIKIETLDPFNNSIADTIAKGENFIIHAGNRIHIKTRQATIRNLLLIKENQVFDSLLVKESERLVRSMGYVNDVSVFAVAVPGSTDSVDVYIRELDKWSIIPNFSASTSSFTVSLDERNFLGLGHDWTNSFTRNHAQNKYAHQINYHIPNIHNTYIAASASTESDENGNFKTGLWLQRPFFSAYTRWAGGLDFSQQLRKNYIGESDTALFLQRFRFNIQDVWAGRAVQLFRGNGENERTTNFVLAARYLRVRFLENPNQNYDPQHYFSNEIFYLISAGISARKYLQDKYLFKFGLTEDIPVGKVYSVTAGVQYKNGVRNLYLGGRVSTGYYYHWGYLGFNFEYGALFYASKTHQGAIVAGINYVTRLKEIGKWKFRHFINPQLYYGINRVVFDSLTLNNEYGLSGFNSRSLSGTSRIVVKVQTQSYSPWNFIGFRFGPFITLAFGMLGDEETGFRRSKVYSQIGLGVLIKNDHLVINTFKLSIAYYPTIPGVGTNIFKFNSFSTSDIGFRDFEIGKPSTVQFR